VIARSRARDMRSAMTDAERKLWGQFSRKRILGVRFRRQVPLGRYIGDFVCLPARLIVEVDGGQHTAERDAARSAWLESQGFVVMRFWTGDVLTGIDGVVEAIQARIARILATPPPTPSRKGRGLESASRRFADRHPPCCSSASAMTKSMGSSMLASGRSMTTPTQSSSTMWRSSTTAARRAA